MAHAIDWGDWDLRGNTRSAKLRVPGTVLAVVLQRAALVW
jgi:hypothetical protein